MALGEHEGWTVETYAAHNEALREAQARFEAERDRRYAEIAAEREKALGIKERADRDALALARQIQDYKDEKANELRSQIERERGDYATQADLTAAVDKIDATMKPLVEYVTTQQGRASGVNTSVGVLVGALVAAEAVFAILSYIVTH